MKPYAERVIVWTLVLLAVAAFCWGGYVVRGEYSDHWAGFR